MIFKYDKHLDKKIDLIGRRISNNVDKKDALILLEGDEGEGKTNHSVMLCSHLAEKTGREFNNSNVYFRIEPMLEKAKKTKGQIFLWDEPALQGLKKEWWNKAQVHLVQLLMMARKNRHLFVFCIIDFTKFNEFIIRRSIMMLRVYTRSEKDKTRRFLYFNRKTLRTMYDAWMTKRKRLYKKYALLHGTLPNQYGLPLILNEELYEAEKDKAIMSIGEEQDKMSDAKNIKLLRLQFGVAHGWNNLKMKGFDLRLEDYTKALGISNQSVYKWLKIEKKGSIFIEKEDETSSFPSSIIHNGHDNDSIVDFTATDEVIDESVVQKKTTPQVVEQVAPILYSNPEPKKEQMIEPIINNKMSLS